MIGANIIAGAMNSQFLRNDQMDATTKKLEQAANGKMTKEAAQMVAKDFESMFVSQMLEHMMGGDSMGDSLFGNAETDEIYKSMMVDEYSKAIVKSGGIGIAGYIEQGLARRELLKSQEI